MANAITRRSFLKTTAAAAGAAGAGLMTSADFARAQGANDRLDIGIIGTGNRAKANIKGVRTENIVSLCDVDKRFLDAMKKNFPKAKTYRDFRRILELDDIDAVVVSTPDHTHAPPAVMAMQAGKHCYCEKPLAHSVHEIRTMTRTAARQKVVTQMGTQIHAEANYRRVVELIQTGAIGPVAECHVWVGGNYQPMERPKERPPVPGYLDWDLWVGPAPMRPYHPAYHPFKWRRWWAFGSGMLGDFGCHYQDVAFWALKLSRPVTIEATGPRPHPETALTGLKVVYEYPARGELPPVKLTWYDGKARPESFKKKEIPQWPTGVLFKGSKGMLLTDYRKHVLLPTEKFKGFEPPEPFIPDSIGHHAEWVRACKTGGETTCSFDYSGPLAEAVALGNVSHRCGEKLEWNAETLEVTNTRAAAKFIRRRYRKGWEL